MTSLKIKIVVLLFCSVISYSRNNIKIGRFIGLRCLGKEKNPHIVK